MGIAGIAGNAEPPVAEVRSAEVLPLNPRAAAGAAGCVRRVSSMLSRLSECDALQQLRVGEPRYRQYPSYYIAKMLPGLAAAGRDFFTTRRNASGGAHCYSSSSRWPGGSARSL